MHMYIPNLLNFSLSWFHLEDLTAVLIVLCLFQRFLLENRYLKGRPKKRKILHDFSLSILGYNPITFHKVKKMRLFLKQ